MAAHGCLQLPTASRSAGIGVPHSSLQLSESTVSKSQKMISMERKSLSTDNTFLDSSSSPNSKTSARFPSPTVSLPVEFSCRNTASGMSHHMTTSHRMMTSAPPPSLSSYSTMLHLPQSEESLSEETGYEQAELASIKDRLPSLSDRPLDVPVKIRAKAAAHPALCFTAPDGNSNHLPSSIPSITLTSSGPDSSSLQYSFESLSFVSDSIGSEDSIDICDRGSHTAGNGLNDTHLPLRFLRQTHGHNGFTGNDEVGGDGEDDDDEDSLEEDIGTALSWLRQELTVMRRENRALQKTFLSMRSKLEMWKKQQYYGSNSSLYSLHSETSSTNNDTYLSDSCEIEFRGRTSSLLLPKRPQSLKQISLMGKRNNILETVVKPNSLTHLMP